jgi:hypothetical protein
MNEDLVILGKSEGEYEFKSTGSVTIEVYDDIKKIIVNLNGSNGITPNAIISELLQNKQFEDYAIEINANVSI